MKALEVFINGHRLCLAGVGDEGALHAIVSWVGDRSREEDIHLSVGGVDCVADENLRWNVPSIGVGAEVLIRVVEAPSVDPPEERHRSERPTTLELYRECLRQFSERLTEEQRQQLLRYLLADLNRKPA